MIRKVALALALTVAGSAFATTLQIDPPAPTSADRVTVSFIAVCADRPIVTIAPPKITIAVQAGGVCLSAAVPVRFTVNLGRLAGGVYDVELTGNGVNAATKRLLVRDVGPFEVSPVGAPPQGGIVALILSDTPIAKVFFGDAQATNVVKASDPYWVATVPPHAPGDVDVTVIDDAGMPHVAHAAFTYFDPAAPPDPFTFEPLLFPVAFHGPGLFGSQWVTENVLKTPYPSLVRGDATADDPAGVLLHVVRGSSKNLRIGSRVSDVSRRNDTAGTEVHVVHERDLRAAQVIVNVPAATNSRATLRAWLFTEEANPGLLALAVNRSVLAPTSRVTRDGYTFFTYDITSALGAPVDILVDGSGQADGKVWAVVSLTNNDTQQVTLVTGQ